MHLKNKTLLATAFSLICAGSVFAENFRSDYDLDNDALIEINDLGDLYEIRNDLTGSSLYGSSAGCPATGCFGFELSTDLDFDLNQDGQIDANDAYWFGGLGWAPIGGSPRFKAIFEGNGHEIKNLFINRPSESETGLFGAATDASLRNIGITGAAGQVSGRNSVGALVGECFTCIIENVYSTVNVIGTFDDVGGLIGRTDFSALVSNSYATGDVTASGPVGGLIGVAGRSVVQESYATGNVSGSSNVGGLFGTSWDGTLTKSCFATGDVTATGTAAGGLFGRSTGRFDTTHTVASFAIGNVSGNFDVGGLIGAVSFSTVNSTYAAGSVTGNNSVGGLFGEVSASTSGSSNYWATDVSGQTELSGDLNQFISGAGALVSQLQCPTSANNNTCASVLLYDNWDIFTNSKGNPAWDFGTSSDLPGLLIDGIVYRDGNGEFVPGNPFYVVQDGEASPISTIMYEGNKGGHTLTFNETWNNTKIDIFDWTAAGHYASMVILATGDNRDSQGLDLSNYNELEFQYRCDKNVSVEAFFGSDKDNAQNYLGDVTCNDVWNTQTVDISGMTRTDIATALWLYAPAYKNTSIPGNAFSIKIRKVKLSE